MGFVERQDFGVAVAGEKATNTDEYTTLSQWVHGKHVGAEIGLDGSNDIVVTVSELVSINHVGTAVYDTPGFGLQAGTGITITSASTDGGGRRVFVFSATGGGSLPEGTDGQTISYVDTTPTASNALQIFPSGTTIFMKVGIDGGVEIINSFSVRPYVVEWDDGFVNNYDLEHKGSLIVLTTGDSVVLTGIAPERDGFRLTLIVREDGFPLTIENMSTSSSPSSRISTGNDAALVGRRFTLEYSDLYETWHVTSYIAA